MPIAHYPSLNLSGKVNLPSFSLFLICCFPTGEKIFPLAWEVVEALELFDIEVVSLVSDGAKPNRRFYNLYQVNQDGVPYKTPNLFRKRSELFFFCDAPHLLKTTRNCFSNSFAHSKSHNLKV